MVLVLPAAAALVALTAAVSALPATNLTVLPTPQNWTMGTSVTCLGADFCVTFDRDDVPQDLRDAAQRMTDGIRASKHWYLSRTRGTEFFNGTGCTAWIDKLQVSVADAASIYSHAVGPAEARPAAEAYNLSVPVSGTAHAWAPTALGGLRALTTFENLWFKIGEEATKGGPRAQLAKNARYDVAYAPNAPYEIRDAPAFGWRAVMLDTSRHFFSVDTLKGLLDTMAFVKVSAGEQYLARKWLTYQLNVLQWHITDSTSWPLELAAYPELAAAGSYDDASRYSEDDVRAVIQYAGERGVDVVMEIDMPGHTASIGESHPDFVACLYVVDWDHLANEPPSGQIRFANATVQDFMRGVVEGALALTASPYFGTGGDELNVQCMMTDNATTAILAANNWTLDDALDALTAKTHGAVNAHSRAPVVWQEMVLKHGNLTGLANNTVVTVWQKSDDKMSVLDRGHRVVLAAADYFYLDCGLGNWILQEGGMDSWCDPYKNWAHLYSFDPYANVTTDDQRQRILGGQTSVWSEISDATNYEQVLWPRGAAFAELWWSGADHGAYPRQAIPALPRMHDMRFRLVDRGVGAGPVQDGWCEVHPGVCTFHEGWPT